MLMKNKNMTVPNCLAGILAALSLVANACIAAEVHVLFLWLEEPAIQP